MREILLVIKGNFRKNKGTYIGIAVMMFIVSITLTSVISVLLNTHKRDWELMESTGFGHIIAGMKYGDDIETYEEYKEMSVLTADDIRDCKDVEKVDVIDTLYFRIADINGGEGNSSIFVIDSENPTIDYNIYDEAANLINDFKLKSGEIIVPVSFKQIYNCKVGDEVILISESVADADENGKQKEYKYTIAAYMEDPYMGASIMGIKTLLLSTEDFNQFYADDFLGKGIILSIFQEKDSDMTITEFGGMLNAKTAYAAKTFFTLDRSQSNTYMTMLINIFAAILIIFAVMIVVATIIVLSNNISSSIEQDFVNLGILKAVGLTNSKLKFSLMMGYLIAILASSLLGIILSVPLIGVINNLITPMVGLYGDNSPQVLLSLGVLGIIFVILVAFILVKLIKISRISPVKAINSGREDVHFSSLFRLPISKKVFGTSLAYRQITSGKKQYVGVTLITAILVFFMVTMTEMCVLFGNGEDFLRNNFSTIDVDMFATMYGEENYEEVNDIIREYDPEANEFIYGNSYILMNDTQIACTVCDKPELFKVYEGRTCTYDNEILITEYLVKHYGIDIGDTVELNINGNVGEFIAVGYFASGNDAGKCIGMNYYAYEALRYANKTEEIEAEREDESIIWAYNRSYKLSDPDKADEIVAAITEKYDENEAVISETDYMEGTEPILAGIYGITILIYVIAGVFVAVTVAMICSKLFAKEKQDNGVYKAMGLTSGKLRNMFAMRFVIVGFIGAVLGVVLVYVLANAIVGVIFDSFGLYNFTLVLNPLSIVVPIVVMAVLYYVFAKLSSKKLKKLTPRVLIVE